MEEQLGEGAMAGPRKVLTVFLSSGGSLSKWRREAILSREIALYFQLLDMGAFDRITFFSYNPKDRGLLKGMAATEPHYHSIDVIAPSTRNASKPLPALVWSIAGPLLNRAKLARAVAFKTNQVSGSWSAMLASAVSKRPLLFRMGYLLSRRFAKNGHKLRAWVARMVEKAAFSQASKILVSAREVHEMLVADGYGAKAVLTPTYVDMNRFRPVERGTSRRSLVTVCRLTPQKNLASLIRACAMTGHALTIYGKGDLEGELKALAKECGADVTFGGMVANEDLVDRLSEHDAFILPSFHEGLPKVLIEAMASGMLCIGSNIPGITDLVEDGVNGYLIDGFEPEDIAATLGRVDNGTAAAIAAAARATVEDSYSLEAYAEREARIYATLG